MALASASTVPSGSVSTGTSPAGLSARNSGRRSHTSSTFQGQAKLFSADPESVGSGRRAPPRLWGAPRPDQPRPPPGGVGPQDLRPPLPHLFQLQGEVEVLFG